MARYRCRSILTMAYIIMCPGLDRPRTVGPGLAVKLIKPDPLRGPLDFFAAVFARTSFGSASHEKAPPLRGRASSSSAQDWIDRGRSDQVWPWSGSSPIRFADLGTFSCLPRSSFAWLARSRKSPAASRQGLIIKCPGLDSNQHTG